MIKRLVLFGATGDLAGRYLLPALSALQATGRLPDGFTVIGASRKIMDDAAFQQAARKRLERHAAHVPAAIREGIVRTLRYRPVDVDVPESVASVIDPRHGPIAAYLALPPGRFAATVTALGDAGLPPGSRIALEKPFGESLDDAVALNELVARTAGDAGEQAVFRVDHVLGMATVQNLVALRRHDRLLSAVWNAEHIEQIEVRWGRTSPSRAAPGTTIEPARSRT
jgi:glucose-6-phosphate 1-dehydrogenase